MDIGTRVRIVRGRRPDAAHTPCVGETGILIGHYPNDTGRYVYAVALPVPEPDGMVIAYHSDELARAEGADK